MDVWANGLARAANRHDEQRVRYLYHRYWGGLQRIPGDEQTRRVAGPPATTRGDQRGGVDLGADDDLRFCRARVRASSSALLNGDDGVDRDGVRFCRDSGADAAVHGSVALQRAAARRAALVAPVGHTVGDRPPRRQPDLPLLHLAPYSEDYFGAHR